MSDWRLAIDGWRICRAICIAFAVTCVAAPAAGAQGAARFGAARTQAEKNAARFDDTFRKYTKRYFGVGFDWHRFKAQAMAESELNPLAESRVGARGLMQLMPSTFAVIASKRPEFTSIDDPEWNIAAGIMHDRYLWKLWSRDVDESHRPAFMFASYNAGEGTITRASARAREQQLVPTLWESIEQVAPNVPKWRYRETLGYVRKIESNYVALSKKGK